MYPYFQNYISKHVLLSTQLKAKIGVYGFIFISIPHVNLLKKDVQPEHVNLSISMCQ